MAAWDNLHFHFRQERSVSLSLIRVTRHGATNKKGDPRISWFIWVGEKLLALEKVAQTHQWRFSLEHTFRFKKQDLRWEQARLGSPEQVELWSQVVSFVMNELVLAQPLNQAYLRPWERQVRKASPQQVRRGMGTIISELGTPARPPKPRGKAPGRAVGAVVKRAERHPVVKKGAKKGQRRKKRA